MNYYLTWYGKVSCEFLGETLLQNVNKDDVGKVFGLDPEETIGCCIEVNENHVSWFEHQGVIVQLDKFDYFVEALQYQE